MIVTVLDLKEKYKDYADINGKIKRDVENNILFPVIRGIYETNSNISDYLLSSYIYGPSFAFALLKDSRIINWLA